MSKYRKPDEADKMKGLNKKIVAAYNTPLEVAPPTAERTLATRKLQEARMWANVAILEITL